MKKIIAAISLLALLIIAVPIKSLAAGGIYASGGGNFTVGQSFTVNVTASGATFDTVHGQISVSGPVSVTSFSSGDATWMSKPSNGGTFDGAFLGQKKTSFTVATIKLKATGIGNGSVNVSGVSLKNAGSVVGTGAGGTNFTIQKAPELPGKVTVSSASHPDSNQSYEATTIELSWNKDSGVDGFSYLLDQAEGTTPAAKADSADTSVTYADKAVGTYYFHIRAHKPDGWGATTHFKVNIKEPDAKIDETLSKPSNIEIKKAGNFQNDIKTGTVSGITISGKTEPGFTANLVLTPTQTLPEGKTLSALADSEGTFEILLDFPISSGFHLITVQGQKEKILTPISDEIRFELAQAQGGSINILTDNDTLPPTPVKSEKEKESFKINQDVIFYGALFLILLAIAVTFIIIFIRRKKERKLLKSIR